MLWPWKANRTGHGVLPAFAGAYTRASRARPPALTRISLYGGWAEAPETTRTTSANVANGRRMTGLPLVRVTLKPNHGTQPDRLHGCRVAERTSSPAVGQA